MSASSLSLQIVTHLWQNRGEYTSVERMCSLLENSYVVSRSAMVGVPQSLATRLKKITNSRAQMGYSAPYNTHFMRYEFAGIYDAVRNQPDIMFFPYADYDYYYSSFLKPIVRARHVLYSYFSVHELQHRYTHLHHYERADCIFAAGHAQVAYLRSVLPDVRIEFLPLGIDTEFFTPDEGSDDLIIVQSGVNRRDIPLALNVLDRLYAIYPKLKAEFVGCSSLKDVIPPRSYLILHDYLDDVQLRAVYRRASLQILPLVDGGSSNSLNEGYACGLPVVVTDLDNIRDYVDPEASFLIRQGEVEDFYNACLLLCERESLRRRMGQAARRRAEELSWDHVIDRFNIVVQEILEN